MALNESDKKYVDSWFTPTSRATENAFAEKLSEVVPIYQEMGFTRGEGAILFMLSQLLTQSTFISNVLQRWDEDDKGDL